MAGALAASFGLPALAIAADPCGDWHLTDSPTIGNSYTRLTAVTARATGEAWAVGHWRDQPAGSGPLVIRWDGAGWSGVALPPTGHLGNLPVTEGVDLTPAGDLWVVGNVTTPAPTNTLPLTLRRQAGAWSEVGVITLRPQTVHPFAPRGGSLTEVDALNDDDVWAVGIAVGYGDGGATTVPLAAHFDGSVWSDVAVPLVANRHHQLTGVAAIASDDVWAVGDYRNVALNYHGVTYHWDGSEWTHVASPIEEISGSGIDDVAAWGPNDVWALGNGNGAVLLMHWDGTDWSMVSAPPNSGGSLLAVGPNQLWVSGWNGYWYWDGAVWHDVPTAVPGSSFTIRSGGFAQTSACDLWCVGFWTEADGVTGSTLAEHLQTDPTAVEAEVSGIVRIECANPYRAREPIRLQLASGGTAHLSVFDLRGARVRRLLESPGRSGADVAYWDGRDENGIAVPRGLYFLRLESGGSLSSAKLLYLGSR
ncbi:MAG: hypothetical protein IT349_12065 [Candidatus Eisenbacteria bacterium]|nr:hypothetical protein [Candidatus Eisenbacteria bacterium]